MISQGSGGGRTEDKHTLLHTMSRASPGLAHGWRLDPWDCRHPSMQTQGLSVCLHLELTLAREFHSSQACFLHDGSWLNFKFSKPGQKLQGSLGPGLMSPQNIILLVMKMLRPAPTERKGALSLPLKERVAEAVWLSPAAQKAGQIYRTLSHCPNCCAHTWCQLPLLLRCGPMLQIWTLRQSRDSAQDCLQILYHWLQPLLVPPVFPSSYKHYSIHWFLLPFS